MVLSFRMLKGRLIVSPYFSPFHAQMCTLIIATNDMVNQSYFFLGMKSDCKDLALLKKGTYLFLGQNFIEVFKICRS